MSQIVTEGSAELKDMLLHGWQVMGFARDWSIKGAMDDIYGETAGYSILLQKHENMAVAATYFDSSDRETKLVIIFLTGKP